MENNRKETEKITEKALDYIRDLTEGKPYETQLPVKYEVASFCARSMKQGDMLHFLIFHTVWEIKKIWNSIPKEENENQSGYIG